MKKTFEQWKKAVDAWLEAKAGLAADDLPDQPYRDWYEDDLPAKSAAARALRYAQEDA